MHDLRLAIRHLLRRPGPSLAAILSLALGIGANTAIYSVLQAVVVRPLPFPAADALIDLAETSPEAPLRAVAPANFVDWQRGLTSVEALAAYDEVALALTGSREAERLRGVSVSGAFFPLLGVTAATGRTLGPADDAPGAPCAAVLGHALAFRLFGGAAPSGEPLTLNGHPCTIVGALPEAFAFEPARDAEIWINGDRGVPRDFTLAGDVTAVRDAHYLGVVARLRPGTSVAAAGAEAQALMARLAVAHPATNAGLGAVATPLHARVVGPIRPVVVGLQVAVALLLLIACANVAHLLLGQAAGRQGEIAMRMALGAGRSRLARQLFAEALALALPGALLGVLLAAWGLDALVAMAPASVPRLSEVRLDGAVLAFTAALAVGTACAFGLGPALHLLRSSTHAAGTPRVSASRGARRWQRALMIGELATAQVLLVGAAWLLSSVAAAQRVPLGYDPAGRLAADLNLTPGRYLQPPPGAQPGQVDARPKWQLVDALLGELDATPGVRATAAALTGPLGGAPNRGVRLDDALATPGTGPAADFQLVTPGFFRTLGIPLERGRGFSPSDREDAPPVAIVNRAFADRYLPGQDPLGHVVVFGGARRHEIVGVAADARYREVEQPAGPTVYVPLRQNDERWGTLSLLVWHDGDPATAGAAVRDALRRADPELPLSRLRTVDEVLEATLAPRRFATTLVGMLTLAALLLAAVGAYGVAAYAAATRTREFGVRSALGASPARLLRALVGESVVVALAASTVGLSLAAAAGGLMSSLLFGVSARDPWPYAGVAVLMLGVVLAAGLPPARRVLRIAPTEALRDAG